VAFFADRKLRTIEVSGGLPQAVADIEVGRGGCWGDDGRILFTPKGGGTVFSVAASGGPVTPMTRLNPAHAENANYWPTCLPGAKRFLYFARSKQPDFNGVYFANTDGAGEPVKVVSSLSSAFFVPPASGRPGYLLWARDTDLLAQPFDAESGRLSGQAVRIATDVLVEESQRGLMAAASSTGTLLWASARSEQLQFAWFDRSGRRLSTVAIDPGHVYDPQLARDERSMLFYRAEKGGADVWLHTFAGGTSRRLTTEPGYNQSGTWLPGGRSILYVSDNGLKRLALDGSAIEKIHDGSDFDVPLVSPDGRFAVTAVAGQGAGRALWAFELAPPHRATQLSSDAGESSDAFLSPDGRWLLWRTANGDRQDVFVARFIADGETPRLGSQRIPIAPSGGEPIGWRGDGRELYYLQRGRDVMAVPVGLQSDSATAGTPVMLFTIPPIPSSAVNGVAVSADGNRFVVTEAPFTRGQTLHLLTNWPSRLK
jgi:hypothetical protein